MVFSFGENGKLGKLDLSKLKDGITMAELGIQENSFEASIFSKFDTDSEKGKLSKNEISVFFNHLKKIAGNDETLSDEELKGYIESQENSQGADVTNFKKILNTMINLITIRTKPNMITVLKIDAPEYDPLIAQIPDETSQTSFIENCLDMEMKARQLYQQINIGAVSKFLEDDQLKEDRSQFARVLDFTNLSNELMLKAKKGELTKLEYFKECREHLKEVLKIHLSRYCSDIYREKQLINDEKIEQYCNNVVDSLKTINDVKEYHFKLASAEDELYEQYLDNCIKQIENNSKKNAGWIDTANKPIISNNTIPEQLELGEVELNELMSFEEVFEFEQGIKYNKYAFSLLAYKEKELEVVLNSHNYLESLKTKFQEVNGSKTIQENLEVFNQTINAFYSQNPEPMMKMIQEVLAQTKLSYELNQGENGEMTLKFAEDAEAQNQQQEIITKLVDKIIANQETAHQNALQGNSLEEYLEEYQDSRNKVFSRTRIVEDCLVENSQKIHDKSYEAIQDVQTVSSVMTWGGMGLSMIGGALCCCPLTAVAGAVVMKAGGGVAMSGMVMQNAVDIAEAETRDIVSEEEVSNAWKMAGVNALAMLIGGGAGKLGNVAFSKVLNSSTTSMIKTLVKNPTMLKTVAVGAKVGTDFGVSLVGDLVLMNAFDTGENWQDLLKANLIGVVIGTATDVKDMSVAFKNASKNVEGAKPVKGKVGDNTAQSKVDSNVDGGVKKPYQKPETEVTSLELADDIVSSSKTFDRKQTPLKQKDLDEINDLIAGLDDFSRSYIVEKIKYKEQIQVLKELFKLRVLDFNEKEASLPDSHYGFMLDKINNLDEFNELKTVISKNPRYWNEFRYYYKTPYFDLIVKTLAKLDNYKSYALIDEINYFIKSFDTPEKISNAEKFLDNLDDSKTFENFTHIKAAINNDNMTSCINSAKSLIDSRFGEGKSLFFTEEELYEISCNISTSSQKKVLCNLIKNNIYDDTIYKILSTVSGDEDVRFIEKIMYRACSENRNKTPQEVQNEIKKYLYQDYQSLTPEQKPFIRSLYSLLASNKLILSEYDKLRELKYSITDIEVAKYIEQKFLDMSYEDVRLALSNDLIYKILDYSENKFTFEAMKITDEYNKNKVNTEASIDLFGFGEENILANIKNQDDLNFYKKLIENVGVIGDSLNFLMKVSEDIHKREIILSLVEYTSKYGKNKDGSINFKKETLENIVKLLDYDGAIDKLNSLFKGNWIGKKYSIDEIYSKLAKDFNNQNFVKELENKYPDLKKYKEEITQLRNPTEFELFTKIYKDEETNPITLVQLIIEAREHKYGYKNLMYIANNPHVAEKFQINSFGGGNILGLQMLISKPDGIEKINKLIESDLYKEFNNDTAIKSGGRFYNEWYIQDKISLKNGNYISHFESKTPKHIILQNVANGHLVAIDGILHIKDGNELVKLNISEKTYLKLFPPAERFLTSQGLIGDCWLISTLDILLKKAKGRVELLKLFKESNGQLYIELPNQKPYLCELDNVGLKDGVKACDGLKYLEKAVAIARANDTKVDVDTITDIDKLIKVLDGGSPEEAFNLIFNNLGKNLPPIRNKAMYQQILEDSANSDNIILKTSIQLGTQIPNEIIQKYGLTDKHAYSIEGYDKKNQIVYIINPHDTKYRLEMPLEEFKKYFSYIYIYNFDKI